MNVFSVSDLLQNSSENNKKIELMKVQNEQNNNQTNNQINNQTNNQTNNMMKEGDIKRGRGRPPGKTKNIKFEKNIIKQQEEEKNKDTENNRLIDGITGYTNNSETNNTEILQKKIMKLEDKLTKNKMMMDEMKNEISRLRQYDDQNKNKMNKLNIEDFVEYYVIRYGFDNPETKFSCWWCTYEFDNKPVFLPNDVEYDMKDEKIRIKNNNDNNNDNENDNDSDNNNIKTEEQKTFDDMKNNKKYIVFGYFCSFNCALSYNIDMKDSSVGYRQQLLLSLLNDIRTRNGLSKTNSIEMAPRRELLKKYGGKLTLEQFREKSKISTISYDLYLPPLVPIDVCMTTRYDFTS